MFVTKLRNPPSQNVAGQQRSEAICNVCKKNIKVPILSILISNQIGKKMPSESRYRKKKMGNLGHLAFFNIEQLNPYACQSIL
jgi:hypothetical protein